MGVFLALFAFLFVVAAFLAMMIGFVNLISGTRRRDSRRQTKFVILKPIRDRFGAENLRPNRLGELNVFRPALVFDYGRTMARLKHFGTPWNKANRQTVLETNIQLRVGLYLLVKSRADVTGRETKADFFKTGDEEFDHQFCVFSNDSSIANQWLTDAVRWKIAELGSIQSAPLIVNVEDGHLTTKVQHWFSNGPDLLDFVQGGLELFDQLMLHKAEGVEFVHQNQAAVIEDFRCPICSDDVIQEMVVCRRCKTPHCAECWEYNGKCATFACMEKRCVRVVEHEL